VIDPATACVLVWLDHDGALHRSRSARMAPALAIRGRPAARLRPAPAICPQPRSARPTAGLAGGRPCACPAACSRNSGTGQLIWPADAV